MTRDETTLQAVRDVDYDPFDWCPIVSEAHGRRATFYVMSDALRVDGIRRMVSATLQQQIADVMGCYLLTPKLVDMIHWDAKVIVTPCIQPKDDHGNPTADFMAKWHKRFGDAPYAMDNENSELLHSEEVDAKVACRQGLVSCPSKDWVLSRRFLMAPALLPNTSCNYGWIAANAPFESHSGIRCWQPLSTRHNRLHRDHSQGCRLVRGDCLLDGVPADVATIMQDVGLCDLISWDGVVPVRQPGVPIAS